MSKFPVAIGLSLAITFLALPSINSLESNGNEIYHRGDLVIEHGETYVIKNTTFVIDGNIYVKDSATLVLKNAKLIVKNNFPWQYWIKVSKGSTLIAENSELSSPQQMNLETGKSSTLILRNFTSHGDIGISVEGATVSIENSERPFNQLFWKWQKEGYPSKFSAVNSTLKRITLTLGGISPPGRSVVAENIEITGMKSGQIENVYFETSEGGVLELKDSSVECWVIEFTSYSIKHITIKDSYLDSIWLDFLPDDSDVKIRDLKPALYSDKMIHQNSLGGYLRLLNTKVGWYKLLLYGVDATIENSRGFQVAPWGEAQVVVKDSIIDRGGVRLRGNETVRFINTSLKRDSIWFLDGKVHDPAHGGDTHIVEFSDSVMNTGLIIACRYAEIKGNVSILKSIKHVNFQTGEVLREYSLLVKEENGDAIPNVIVNLTDSEGKQVWSGITNKKGEASFNLLFTKDNYDQEWCLNLIKPHVDLRKEVGFLSSTPIVLTVPAPARFKVSNLKVSKAKVSPSEPIIVSATVTNVGSRKGNYDVKFYVMGELVVTKTVTLPPGESTVVQFTTAKTEEGTYRVKIGNLTGSFKVKLSKPISLIPIIGIVAAIAIGIGIMAYTRRKQLSIFSIATSVQY